MSRNGKLIVLGLLFGAAGMALWSSWHYVVLAREVQRREAESRAATRPGELVLAGSGGGPEVVDGPLPVFSTLPDFTLVERSGRTITRADLLGHVWVADVVFTTCPGPCPALTERMHGFQELWGPETGVQFLTVTSDPERDTPEMLREYAHLHRADPKRWLFLTGAKPLVKHFTVDGLQFVDEDGNPEAHSTRIALIDKLGRIRGTYVGTSDSDVAALRLAVPRLLAETNATSWATRLPALNACLNALAALLIFSGWRAIKVGNRDLHARLMASAVTVSAVFLVSYLTHKFLVGPKTFPVCAMKPWYLALLTSHTILAILVVPLVIRTVVLARRGNFTSHKGWARWTLPIWAYVSVTGVLVYFMLYQWYA